MEFIYTAQDSKKNVITATIDGSDKFSVAHTLREQGLFPISVKEKVSNSTTSNFMSGSSLFKKKVTLQEKIVFANNLAGMLSAGLTLYRSLEVLKKQNKNSTFDEVLQGLLSMINQGGTLSDGLSKYPKIFSTLFISMVRAGEESGNLSSTLSEVSSSLGKTYALNLKVKSALMYPSVIISAMGLIGILMLIFVVPTITKVFTDSNVTLPITTQFIVNISGFASNHPFYFVGSIGLIVGLFIFLFKAKSLIPISDKLVLKLPGIGLIVKEVNSARTARTLSSLLTSGVDMIKAIGITKDVLQNMYYKQVMEKAGTIIQKGETLSSVFKSETELYPVMLGEMVAVGEETGALTTMLTNVADYYEKEVDEKTKNLSTIIEPVLMVFIGAAVGFFAIAIISPIYSLMNTI
jgi:type IV pilus assembly protein PilC